MVCPITQGDHNNYINLFNSCSVTFYIIQTMCCCTYSHPSLPVHTVIHLDHIYTT